jgi:large subunit ribosomal protein L29e
MAKSKNHTNHNQGYKDHRHGIKIHKPIDGVTRKMSQKGLENKLRRTRKFSAAGQLSAKKQKVLRDEKEEKAKAYRMKRYETFKTKLTKWKALQKKSAQEKAKAKK